MKKIKITILALSVSLFGFSQQFYGAFSVGYGVGAPGEILGTNNTVDASANSTATNNQGSFGAGLNLTLAPGYMFSEHIGIELGANYLMGSEVDVTSFNVPTGSLTAVSKSTQLRLTPSIVISSGSEGVNVYGKAGVIVPISGSTTVNVTDNINPLSIEEYSVESKGDLSIGFTGAIGVSYGFSEKLSLFGEINGVNLRIRGKSQTITSYTVNGTDIIPLLEEYEKETVFVDELNANSNNFDYNLNSSSASAKEELVSSSNFNALTFNIGLKFRF